ncbi:hypothetical protein [Myceligenerans pegani]|uniref:Uncharacterized protein n=1 Tax=Myceligenerans pegani TaxID=2776917 RepID=A0ABR9N3A5_9MICO|nr:hypothetical protein [Myceligenerans sp. TRM 65318]MBE1878142.1 hypothetical protein [Myceligenerans sp. TRM 65318]MBE3020413.1 hypothetical protein [Myceligenerans sp. TRM 65318]
MSEERQITSDDNDATENATDTRDDARGDSHDEGRIERLRELLTAPIKIPESESGARGGEESSDPEDYPAPSVDIPPHVRAAAEAAAHAGDDEQLRDESRRTKSGKKRRTWADAFLDTGRRDLSAAGDDAATQLLTRLDELDRRTGEDIAHVRARAETATETAAGANGTAEAALQGLEATTARIDDVEQRVTAAGETAEATDRAVAALREHADAVRDEITQLTTSLADAERSAATARDQAAAAAKKAGTATVVAVIAVVLALAALGAAFAL